MRSLPFLITQREVAAGFRITDFDQHQWSQAVGMWSKGVDGGNARRCSRAAPGVPPGASIAVGTLIAGSSGSIVHDQPETACRGAGVATGFRVGSIIRFQARARVAGRRPGREHVLMLGPSFCGA